LYAAASARPYPCEFPPRRASAAAVASSAFVVVAVVVVVAPAAPIKPCSSLLVGPSSSTSSSHLYRKCRTNDSMITAANLPYHGLDGWLLILGGQERSGHRFGSS